MKCKAGIITFPGSNCDQDIATILSHFYSMQTDLIWYRNPIQKNYDLLVLPGGFSYGDYLRSGAIAGHTAALKSVREHASRGGAVLGICNGFQILCEAGLLPGALMRNSNMKHIACNVEVETGNWPGWKSQCQLTIPVSHSEGNFQADKDTLSALQDERRIVICYRHNVNGSAGQIAGISSANHRVVGMMPHPERAVDPLTGGQDGRKILDAVVALCA